MPPNPRSSHYLILLCPYYKYGHSNRRILGNLTSVTEEMICEQEGLKSILRVP